MLFLKGKHLANVVVVRVSVYTLKQSLTNKIKRVRAAVEALVGRVKAYLLLCNGLGLAQTYSSTSWDSSCTGIYICSSAHLRQSIQRSSSPLSSSSCTVTVMSPEAFI
jgi:hypothetical protein